MAPANRHDSPLLGETLLDTLEALGPMPERVSVHLDRGDGSEATRKRPRGSRPGRGGLSEGQAGSLAGHEAVGGGVHELLLE